MLDLDRDAEPPQRIPVLRVDGEDRRRGADVERGAQVGGQAGHGLRELGQLDGEDEPDGRQWQRRRREIDSELPGALQHVEAAHPEEVVDRAQQRQ